MMTKNFFNKPIYSLLLVLTFLTVCNGQVKPVTQKDNENTFIGQTKISKPIGTNSDLRLGYSIEDSDGNLWFCSYGEGLYKYDGKLFVHFGMEQGLNSKTIYSILQDKTGNVWVGTNKGLNRFDGNKFLRIPIVLSNNTSSYLSNTLNPQESY
jgi:hypothetical protein